MNHFFYLRARMNFPAFPPRPGPASSAARRSPLQNERAALSGSAQRPVDVSAPWRNGSPGAKPIQNASGLFC